MFVKQIKYFIFTNFKDRSSLLFYLICFIFPALGIVGLYIGKVYKPTHHWNGMLNYYMVFTIGIVGMVAAGFRQQMANTIMLVPNRMKLFIAKFIATFISSMATYLCIISLLGIFVYKINSKHIFFRGLTTYTIGMTLAILALYGLVNMIGSASWAITGYLVYEIILVPVLLYFFKEIKYGYYPIYNIQGYINYRMANLSFARDSHRFLKFVVGFSNLNSLLMYCTVISILFFISGMLCFTKKDF